MHCVILANMEKNTEEIQRRCSGCFNAYSTAKKKDFHSLQSTVTEVFLIHAAHLDTQRKQVD